MKYMGSKAKVARYIVPIIQKQIERSGYETYLEPFCGGCNVIDYREACRIFCNMLHSDSEVLLVAHNIQFDLLFILEMFKRCGMVPKAPKLRALDSLTVYKDRAAYPHKLANAIEHYGLADKVQNSHRAIDDVLALYEVTKAMSEERDDLTDYIDLLGYNPKYGITGRKLRQITYIPQSYKLGCRLPDLMNGGGSCE